MSGDEFETARITITRVLTADGADIHNVEDTPGMSLVEAGGNSSNVDSASLSSPSAAQTTRTTSHDTARPVSPPRERLRNPHGRTPQTVPLPRRRTQSPRP